MLTDEQIQFKISQLESKLTGVFFDDLYIQEEIHYLKRQITKTESISCNLDEGCISCGS